MSGPITAARLEVEADPWALYELSLLEGFGDGLPLLPPTDDRVAALVDATPYAADQVIGYLAPQGGPASVEKVAVNAAMAGVTPGAFPYLIAALEAICEREFNMFALATTTSSVAPSIIVNGARRDELGFDMSAGCMGGAAGRGSSTVGRALMLCLRNIGAQKVGYTSKSVFGQPARTAGLCFAEFEEQSPWEPLAVRRGSGIARGDEAVTVHGSKGTFPMADIHNDNPRDLLQLIAKTLAFWLSNKYLDREPHAGQVVLIPNPMWCQRFGKEFPVMGDLEQFLWEHAWQPIESWPAHNRKILEDGGRVAEGGKVRINARPDQFVVACAGGLGNLHAICLPSWGGSEFQVRKVVR